MRNMITAVILAPLAMPLQAQDDWFTGSANVEVNVGRHKETKHYGLYDFPHITLDASAQMGKGWSAVAEVEYERFYHDGTWDNNLRSDYATNALYINKRWAESLNVRGGIIGIPVGITNSGGPALTIYDPVSESLIAPMTWHDGGLAVWGSCRRWSYSAGLYIYGDAPLKRSRVLGTALRASYLFPFSLSVGISGFYGDTRRGMWHQQQVAAEGKGHDWLGSVDAWLENGGWTADGSVIMTNGGHDVSAGVEAGYDVMQAVGVSTMTVIPFVRYDGVFREGSKSLNRYLVGVNLSPLPNLVFKADFAFNHKQGGTTRQSVDASLGYTIEF